ncbi:CDP-alcohol phosphatidyltransferase family protein [Arthrobacter sp. Ld5]|uniref:CDP-alcohol phosphatidyltransferase family protein n=1 Tax=Arthrobacter sp. Ld5 TaxID=649152 RepID=UPI003EBB940D
MQKLLGRLRKNPSSAGAIAPRSRAATNDLLAQAKDSGWRLGSWVRVLRAAGDRSIDQARTRPRALVEVTVLHLLVAGIAGRRGTMWALTTWFLAVTHLGLLEDRTSLGLANTLTLLRANLPAIEHVLGTWVPALALVSDFVDGKLARATATVSSFGQYADFLSDTALWTWFSLRHEPSRTVQLAALAAWLAPVIVVLSGSVLRGRMIDVPRKWWFRPAATVQVLLGTRMALRWLRSRPLSDGQPP